MNLDIANYGMYRLTSHGGQAYDLFNRSNGKVYSIDEKDYKFIHFASGVGKSEGACLQVERENAIRVIP